MIMTVMKKRIRGERQMNGKKNARVLILDFGAQYSQLIARRIRECRIYCEVRPGNCDLQTIKDFDPTAVVFSGGPNSVYDPESPKACREVFELGIPILGICYGCQLVAHMLGGEVRPAVDRSGDEDIYKDLIDGIRGGVTGLDGKGADDSEDRAKAAKALGSREFGKTLTSFDTGSKLFAGIPKESVTWMSHGDYVAKLPAGFKATARTAVCETAGFECEEKGFYALQFHPEVMHTEYGKKIIENFLYGVCGFEPTWTMRDYKTTAIADIRARIGDGNALLALSGGVDSSVAAALMAEAIGDRLTCVFVDHGLMRKNEGDEVEAAFAKWNIKLVRVDAGERFLGRLAGVTEPEKKRKIIGEEFIRVFEEEAKKIGKVDFLVQGTIYPDVIESGLGKSAVIKSHHNVGGLPDHLEFREIIEPLRMLFKDEVRALGRELGLSDVLVNRQPFPGPGLAIRVIGEVTKEKVAILQDADYIFREEVAKHGYASQMSQYFAALTSMRSVGVMGDGRTYDYTLALRGVTTDDFMTADWARIPYELLDTVSRRIVNEVKGINRVMYDITSKPPATIELE